FLPPPTTLKSGILILTTYRLLCLLSSSTTTPTSASSIPLAFISHILSSKKSLKSVFHSPRIRFQVIVSSDGWVFDSGSGSGSSIGLGSRSIIMRTLVRGKEDCGGFLVKFCDSWRARAWESKDTSGSNCGSCSGLVFGSGASTGTGGELYSTDRSVITVGVTGILRKEQEIWESIDKSLQDAFQDSNAFQEDEIEFL
ncbi:vacuolar protein sorting-associated protein 36-like, partial [Hibiscus syriacus]|uniref:vacuolar protein sorting-associated protein 36-like n=1 Tax=Hibiscus syriacus TaxID=106335 RepID=UPI001920A015